MSYIDGFVIPVPKEKLAAYRRWPARPARSGAKHGALKDRECVADDVPPGKRTSFPRSVKLKPDEVVMFSYIVYESRKDRDRVDEKGHVRPAMKS